MRVVEQLAETPKLVNDLGDVTAETLMSRLQLGYGHAEGQFLSRHVRLQKGHARFPTCCCARMNV